MGNLNQEFGPAERAKLGHLAYLLEGARSGTALIDNIWEWLSMSFGTVESGLWLMAEGECVISGAHGKIITGAEFGRNLTRALRQGIVELALKRDFVYIPQCHRNSPITQPELAYLRNKSVIAIKLRYNCADVGILVLFRNTSFNEAERELVTIAEVAFSYYLSNLQSLTRSEKNTRTPAPAPKKKQTKDEWWRTGGKPPI